MDYPDTQYIEVEREEAWMTLWFNQAEKRNPLTDDATAELKSMFKILRQDRSVRGVTLRGRGGVFCSGGDLKSFKSDFQSSSNRGAIMEMSRGAADLFDGFNSLPHMRNLSKVLNERDDDWSVPCPDCAICYPAALALQISRAIRRQT